MNKIIGIVGSRRRNSVNDYLIVRQEFLKIYEKGDTICGGGCPKGADNFAERISKKFNVPIKIFYAKWDKFGKGAGIIRNSKIVENSDILIAYVSLDRTGGTEDTINKFVKYKQKGKLILC